MWLSGQVVGEVAAERAGDVAGEATAARGAAGDQHEADVPVRRAIREQVAQHGVARAERVDEALVAAETALVQIRLQLRRGGRHAAGQIDGDLDGLLARPGAEDADALALSPVVRADATEMEVVNGSGRGARNGGDSQEDAQQEHSRSHGHPLPPAGGCGASARRMPRYRDDILRFTR